MSFAGQKLIKSLIWYINHEQLFMTKKTICLNEGSRERKKWRRVLNMRWVMKMKWQDLSSIRQHQMMLVFIVARQPILLVKFKQREHFLSTVSTSIYLQWWSAVHQYQQNGQSLHTLTHRLFCFFLLHWLGFCYACSWYLVFGQVLILF